MRHDAIKTEAINRVAKEASTRAAAGRESIVAFAERHGWVAGGGDSTDYFNDVTLTKQGRSVSLALWPGMRKSIAFAHTHNGTASVRVPEPVRERVERFLIGMECVCVSEPDWLGSSSAYEGRPVADCPVHGA